jgi:excisionase family DNA binding protein
MSIANLNVHASPYVTVDEVARYLHVSRRQILKQIQAGTLMAIRLGPRLYRIPVSAAREFERRLAVATREDSARHP